jgi:SPP1 gp7 family putative phage head morphogenesis protein
MSDVERLARTHRREILDLDVALTRDLLDAYQRAWVRLRVGLDALTAQIEAAGNDADIGWLWRQERWRALERQIAAEVGAIARAANGTVSQAQRTATRLAEQHARVAVTEALGEPPAGVFFSFNQLNPEAVRALVGSLGDGKPLAALLDALGPEASRAVREALTDGVVLGEGPAVIARRARAAFGGNAVRAVTVARTETLRAYRQASWASYRANDDVVKGWRWVASLGPRTCAACIAKHGSTHPLTEEFFDHPRGRCTASPVTRTWAELGFDVPDSPPATGQTGSEWFADQAATVQDRIAGRAKAAAVRSGAVALEDLVGEHESRTWGRTLREKSLTEVVGAERARKIIAEARA